MTVIDGPANGRAPGSWPDPEHRGRVTAPTLLDLIDAMWSYRFLMAVLLVLSGLAGYMVGTKVEPRYQSQVVLEAADPRNLVGVFGTQLPGVGTSSAEIAALAAAPVTRLRAVSTVGRVTGPVDVTATAGEDNLVTLSVTAERPGLAVRLAEAAAEVVVQEQHRELKDELNRLSSTLRERADASEAEVTELEGELAAGRATLAVARAPGAVLDAAQLEAIAAQEERIRSLELRRDQLRTAQQQFRKRAEELDIEAGRREVRVKIVTRATPPEDVTLGKPWSLAVLGSVTSLLGAMAMIYVRLSLRAARAERRRLAPAARALLGPDGRRLGSDPPSASDG